MKSHASRLRKLEARLNPPTFKPYQLVYLDGDETMEEGISKTGLNSKDFNWMCIRFVKPINRES